MPGHLIEEIEMMNRTASSAFTDADERLSRKHFRAEHPTEIAAFKCMDGRVHLPILTNTPLGIIHPMRNIGGVFNLGWPALSYKVVEMAEYAAGKGRRNLWLASYHYSASDNHLGCRGHNYDTNAAKSCAWELVGQIDEIFGRGRKQVYPVMIGVETDLGALVFHDRRNERKVSMAELIAPNAGDLRAMIDDFYPDMQSQVKADLLPLMLGNVEYVRARRMAPQEPMDLDHRERVLAVGQGFDWLHRPNFALIVNDLDPKLDNTIGAAAGIIGKNRDAGRIPDSGAIVMASVPYREHGAAKNAAVKRARYLIGLAQQAIDEFQPQLKGFFHPIAAVVDWHTRRLERVDT